MSSDKVFCMRKIAQAERTIKRLKLRINFYKSEIEKVEAYQKNYRRRKKDKNGD